MSSKSEAIALALVKLDDLKDTVGQLTEQVDSRYCAGCRI